MGRKNGQKGKGQKAREIVKTKPEAPEKPGGEDDRFDVGGLPGRDLKKNLGCG